ncbi:MAG: acyl carrier protein [Bacteroidales bacterium]|nr:acyl carrier protein [Candidatus Colimorpha merdihippi]
MTRQQISDKLELIAQAVFGQPELKISDELSASNVPAWTSLTFTQFLSEIEHEFGFKFKMIEILKMKNMGAIIDSVLNHIG